MVLSKTLTRIFIDESGTPDLFVPDKNLDSDKYITIVAIIIEQRPYLEYKGKIDLLCDKYKKYIVGREIKSRSIRRSNPTSYDPKDIAVYDFYKYEEGIEKYNSFCAELKKILIETDFKILSATTNKETAQRKHPRLNFYEILISDLLERISIYNILNDNPRMRIIFDETKTDIDVVLRNTYRRFKEFGTWYFQGKKLNAVNLEKNILLCESHHSRGIQLADLCAHPIKKKMEHGRYGFFEECIRGKLHSKIHDKVTDKNIEMGLKRSLN